MPHPSLTAYLAATSRRTVGWFGFGVLCLFVLVAWKFNFHTALYQNFVYQADAFLHGQLHYRLLPPTLADSACFSSRCFWPLGPFPSLLILPLVAAFGVQPFQAYLQVLVTSGVAGLAYAHARRQGFSWADGVWLALAFTFGSVYLGVAFKAYAWQFAAGLACLGGLAALYLHRIGRSSWLVGLVAAAAIATRLTAGVVLIPIALAYLMDHSRIPMLRARSLAALMAPVLVALLLLGLFNYVRFGSPLETGYTYADVSPAQMVAARAQYGLVSLAHVPTNLYFYFLAPPRPVVEPSTNHLVPPYVTLNLGVGFFYLSPFFLLMFRGDWRKRWRRLVGAGALVGTGVLLTYYATNYFHFGTYYLADVLPLYYLLLLEGFREARLVGRERLLILLSLMFNFYLFAHLPKLTLPFVL